MNQLAISSSVCPQLDLPALIERVKTEGCQGLVLRGLQGCAHLPTCPSLTDVEAVKAMVASAGIQLVCLASGCSLGWSNRRTLGDHKRRLLETVELAAALGCPYVSFGSGTLPAGHNHDTLLCNIVSHARELAGEAAERGVFLLLENQGNLAASRDAWYIADAAANASVSIMWHPDAAQAVGDSHSLAVPRVGRKTAAVSIDAASASAGGQEQTDLCRFLTLMHGVGYAGWLIVDSPEGRSAGGECLTAVVAWVKAELARMAATPELSAYKGDKNAPRFASTR